MEKIDSRRNGKIVHAKNLGRSRSYRTEHCAYLCEGMKMMLEALSSSIAIESVFTTDELDIVFADTVSVYKVSQDLIDSISPLSSPQNVLFICKIPKPIITCINSGTHILLDNVQDPGNVGTILRSAYAFGIDSVILFGDCADVYNPKTLRASMGTIFKQRFLMANADQISKSKIKLIGAAKGEQYTTVDKANYKDSVIVFGNEGQGISDELAELCNEMITIPIAPGCESLNVATAASIIMWEASKQKQNIARMQAYYSGN